MENILPMIEEAKKMKKLDDSEDKTQASVTKYTKKGQYYKINLNQSEESLSHGKMKKAVSKIIENSMKLRR